MGKRRVLLVDDQKLFVENLKTVLDLTTDDIEVVGIAYDGREAVAMVDRLRPDVVLMDVRMPVMDGVEATRLIHDRHRDVTIIVLTTFDNDDYVRDALKHGAQGYLLKSIPPERLFHAIRTVSTGGVLVSPEVAGKMVRWETRAPVGGEDRCAASSAAGSAWESLSPRELELIGHIAMAYSNKEIAAKMCLSEQTVKNYTSRIYAKLGVARRSQLMKLYHEVRRSSGET